MSNTITDFTSWSEITKGDGSTERTDTLVGASTGTSTDAYGVAYKAVAVSWDGVVDVDSYTWFNEAGIAVSVYSWVRLAVDNLARSDLENKGIQFVMYRSGLKILAQSHDGTALESTELPDIPLFYNDYHHYRFVLDPGVSVKFYYDDVLKATHTTRIPRGSGAGVKIAVGATHPGASGSYGQGVRVTEVVESRNILFPSDAITRVTGLHHIYRPGLYRLEMMLGDISNTIDIVEHEARKKIVEPARPAPVTIQCPPGQHIAYDNWDTDRQYPYCVLDMVSAPPPAPTPTPPTPGVWPGGRERFMGEPEPPAGPTPLHRGGIVGGLESLGGRFVGMGGGLEAYRAKKLAEEQAAAATKRHGVSAWSKITPWKEEKGETFTSAVKKIFGGWL